MKTTALMLCLEGSIPSAVYDSDLGSVMNLIEYYLFLDFSRIKKRGEGGGRKGGGRGRMGGGKRRKGGERMYPPFHPHKGIKRIQVHNEKTSYQYTTFSSALTKQFGF